MNEFPMHPQRPNFHFTPEKGWINDPNGLIFAFGQFHLFAQHYPYDTQWGAMHWIHAVSDDLYHWFESGIALEPVRFYSSVNLIDWQQTGTFGPEGNQVEGVWECPDCFPITMPDGEKHWVLVLSHMRLEGNRETKTQYFIGNFDGQTINCAFKEREPLLIDPGCDNYAAVGFNNVDQPLQIA